VRRTEDEHDDEYEHEYDDEHEHEHAHEGAEGIGGDWLERSVREDPQAIEPPPLLGSWRKLYLLVVVELGALVLLFYALTRWAS